MGDFPIIDIDSHFISPPDFWADSDRSGATIDGDSLDNPKRLYNL